MYISLRFGEDATVCYGNFFELYISLFQLISFFHPCVQKPGGQGVKA